MEESSSGFGKDDFVNQLETPLLESYEVMFEIGRGAFSTVYQVKQKSTGQLRACKYISKANFTEKSLKQFDFECELLKQSDHPYIVKLFDIFQTDKSYYLIMEKCEGGSLSNRIEERINHKKPFDEKILSEIIHQIASSIKYLHERNICHRDLKPDNICLTNTGPLENNVSKLIDFGLTKLVKNDSTLNSVVGSVLYVAPEVLQQNYTKKCDVWSLGVMIFFFVGGYPPFLGLDDSGTKIKILSMKYEFKEGFENASEEVKDLISHCLVREEDRYTIDQVLEHPWIKKEKIFPENLDNMHQELRKNLRIYKSMDEFEKKIIMYIAMRLDQDEVKKFDDLFVAIDLDDNGTLSKEEFKQGIQKIENHGLSEDDINKIFDEIDTNENGKIEYTEFISSIIGKNIYLKKEKLKEVFDEMDSNKTGKISKNDICSFLHLEENLLEKYQNLLIKIGKGKDDEIGFDDFFKIICTIISNNKKKK